MSKGTTSRGVGNVQERYSSMELFPCKTILNFY